MINKNLSGKHSNHLNFSCIMKKLNLSVYQNIKRFSFPQENSVFETNEKDRSQRMIYRKSQSIFAAIHMLSSFLAANIEPKLPFQLLLLT